MKKIVRLTESDLTRLVNRIIQEQEQEYPGYNPDWDEYKQGENEDLPTRLKRMNKSYDDNDYQLKIPYTGYNVLVTSLRSILFPSQFHSFCIIFYISNCLITL